jgi:thioredoxin reductase (NADPH)
MAPQGSRRGRKPLKNPAPQLARLSALLPVHGLDASAVMTQKTDVAIIGAGPVGLFAVFECGMVGLSCHVIDALDAIGGQCSALYPEKPIYDIPGFPRISGAGLVEQLEQQVTPFNPVYHLGQRVDRLERLDGGGFRLTTSKGSVIEAGAVIIAAGAGAFGPNRPPLNAIEDFEGQPGGSGVHYLVRRPEDFRARKIVIAGGGDSAVDWALMLHGIAAQIWFVHRRDQFRAAPDNVAKLRALNGHGLDIVVPYQLYALEGGHGVLTGVTVKSLEGDSRLLPADALLAFFGLIRDLGPIAQWGLELERQHLTVDPATCPTPPAPTRAANRDRECMPATRCRPGSARRCASPASSSRARSRSRPSGRIAPTTASPGASSTR